MSTPEQVKISDAFRKLHEKLDTVKLEEIVNREAFSEEVRLLRLKEAGIMDEDPMEHAVQNWRSWLFRYYSKVKDCFKKHVHI